MNEYKAAFTDHFAVADLLQAERCVLASSLIDSTPAH